MERMAHHSMAERHGQAFWSARKYHLPGAVHVTSDSLPKSPPYQGAGRTAGQDFSARPATHQPYSRCAVVH